MEWFPSPSVFAIYLTEVIKQILQHCHQTQKEYFTELIGYSSVILCRNLGLESHLLNRLKQLKCVLQYIGTSVLI